MEKKVTKSRAVKLFALLIVAVILTASLSGCLSSCSMMLSEEYFAAFMDELAVSMLSGDALSVNILLSNPSALKLENEKATLPEPGFDKAEWEENTRSIKQICDALLQYDYSSLSPAHKCDFDTVMNYFYTYSCYADYYYLRGDYIGSTSGWNVNLPIYLDKYALRDKHDVENWISLAGQPYTVFPKYLQFEQERMTAGYGRADYIYSGIAEQCASIVDTSETGGVHFLVTLFNEKIAECSFLTEAEKDGYKQQAAVAVNTKLIPAYNELASGIALLGGTGNQKGLCYYEGGKDYYSLLFEDNASTSDGVDTAFANLASAYNDAIARARAIYAELGEKGMSSDDVTAALTAMENGADLSRTAIEGYYSTLKTAYSADFPALPSSVPDAVFKEVDSSMSKFYNPASYFKSAVDSDSAEETIYVNEGGAGGYIGFDLISHEGIPGHQLQHAYYKTSGASMLRSLLGYTGYMEGWATYAQYYAAKYYGTTDTDKAIYKLFLINDELTTYILTMMDMDVNYYGLTREQLMDKYDDYGFAREGISNVFEYVVENPAVYTSYGYGYYKLSQLRKTYNGSDLAFHTAVLSVGPTTYELLAKYL